MQKKNLKSFRNFKAFKGNNQPTSRRRNQLSVPLWSEQTKLSRKKNYCIIFKVYSSL